MYFDHSDLQQFMPEYVLHCYNLCQNTFCTANPRIYASKVDDRTSVHAPNHVPGQKPITIGHEYSVLAYLPDGIEERATLGGSVISQTGSI